MDVDPSFSFSTPQPPGCPRPCPRQPKGHGMPRTGHQGGKRSKAAGGSRPTPQPGATIQHAWPLSFSTNQRWRQQQPCCLDASLPLPTHRALHRDPQSVPVLLRQGGWSLHDQRCAGVWGVCMSLPQVSGFSHGRVPCKSQPQPHHRSALYVVGENKFRGSGRVMSSDNLATPGCIALCDSTHVYSSMLSVHVLLCVRTYTANLSLLVIASVAITCCGDVHSTMLHLPCTNHVGPGLGCAFSTSNPNPDTNSIPDATSLFSPAEV